MAIFFTGTGVKRPPVLMLMARPVLSLRASQPPCSLSLTSRMMTRLPETLATYRPPTWISLFFMISIQLRGPKIKLLHVDCRQHHVGGILACFFNRGVQGCDELLVRVGV